jgi:glycine cleavage system H protein
MSDFPENLKYAKSHEWSALEDGNVVRVGITDFAQEELGDLVFVELPEAGKKVTAGEVCAVVESVKAASDLYSPVTGEVIDSNQAVIDEPELVNDDAFGTWLFCIKADDISQLEALMSAAEYQKMIND